MSLGLFGPRFYLLLPQAASQPVGPFRKTHRASIVAAAAAAVSNGSTNPTQRNARLRQQLHFIKRRLALIGPAHFHPACCRFSEQRFHSPASCSYGSALAGAFRYPPTSGSSWSSVGLGCPPRKPEKRCFSWEPEGTGRGSEGGKIMACGSVKPLSKLRGLRLFPLSFTL